MTQASAVKTSTGSEFATRGEEPVLVFESNLAGRHGRGVSLLAERCHGAQAGKGFGYCGNSFAIPTSNSDLVPLTRDIVANYIRGFLTHAASHPQQQFRVMALGFGNPHLKAAEIAAMFRDAPANCLLPGRWLELLGQLDTARVIVLDSSAALAGAAAQKRLDEYFAISAPLWSTRHIEIVSVGSANSVVANDQYARSRRYRHRIVSVNESFYRNYLNQAREEMAVWYATRLVSLSEPEQTQQGNQVRIVQAAMRAGLEIEDILLGAQ